MRRFWTILVILLSSGTAQAQIHAATGIAQTGPNWRCGFPIWGLDGIPIGPQSSGAFLGVLDQTPGATNAQAIGGFDCPPFGDPDRLVATYYDASFGSVRSWIAPNVALLNNPLRLMPYPAGNGVYAPAPLPGSVPPNPAPPTIAEPTTPITIGSWLAGTGELVIDCREDGSNTASLAVGMRGLVPNGLYTVWGHWADATGELIVASLGGLPNTLMADVDGEAEYCRELAFCPTVLAPDSSSLQFVSAMYQGNGETYGAVPYEPFATSAILGFEALPFLSTLPGGITTFDHVGFGINATGGPAPPADVPALCVGDVDKMTFIPPWGIATLTGLTSIVFVYLMQRQRSRSLA